MSITNLTDVFIKTKFNAFTNVINDEGIIAGLCVEGADRFSRKQIDKLTDFVKGYGAKGLVWLKHHHKKI